MPWVPSVWNSWIWAAAGALRASESTLQALTQVLEAGQASAQYEEPGWTTPNEIRLDLPTVRIREFSDQPNGAPTLIVAPYALHGAALADLAHQHSLVELLLACGLRQLSLVECKSATAAMQFFSIDSYLADLAVAIQDLGRPVRLIGLCQGGWLSLMFAARFPEAVDRIVLAGSPIDLDAETSGIVQATRATAPEFFQNLVRSGDGLMQGPRMLQCWGMAEFSPSEVGQILQIGRSPPADLVERFGCWNRWAVNLPGTYYLQVVEQLFRRNELARGEFRALGRVLDLETVRRPLYLLAGRDDDVTPAAQVLSARHLVGTPAAQVRTTVTRCGHLSLFMGARTLRNEWRQIAEWMGERP
jgi:poly(3-hydroxyalkanoate) synthetase